MRAKKWLLVVAGLVGFAWSGSTKAGTIEIALQETVGTHITAFTVIDSGAGFTPLTVNSLTFGDFDVTVLSADAVNGASLSELLNSTLSIQNVSGAAATLQVSVTETDYSLPTGTPLTMESGLGGSVTMGTILPTPVVFQAYADNTDSSFGTGFTNGPQVALLTGTTMDTGSVQSQFPRSSPTSLYSASSVVTVALGAGGTINYSDHVDFTVAPLPATASTGLALVAGLAVVGGVSVIRRRQMA